MVETNKQEIRRRDKDSKSIEEMDHEICKGCLPAISARKYGNIPGVHCVGNPFVRNEADEITECPCGDCLIKGMCRKICNSYVLYRDFSEGHISYKLYKEALDENKCENEIPDGNSEK